MSHAWRSDLDFVSKDKRSNIMRGVRSKDTKPERRVRSLLHGKGYRFRIHDAKLPGKPDIVLPKHRAVIFVHGCFWHHHVGCRHARYPLSNSDFWRAKIERTRERDVSHEAVLAQDGWNVITIWECELGDTERLLAKIGSAISGFRTTT